MEKAKADAEKVKLVGAAEATAIENVGRAEAEAMRLKAAAYKLYGEAATLSLVFEALPKVLYMLSVMYGTWRAADTAPVPKLLLFGSRNESDESGFSIRLIHSSLCIYVTWNLIGRLRPKWRLHWPRPTRLSCSAASRT